MEKNNVTRIKQINIKKAWYIVGFADGEGSFNLSWRKRDDYLIGWKVSPVFNISQKEKTILSIIKNVEPLDFAMMRSGFTMWLTKML